MWFGKGFPEAPQASGSAFSCCEGTSAGCMAGGSSVGAGFLAAPMQQPDSWFSLQGLWNLLKALCTSQRDFYQKADAEKRNIWMERPPEFTQKCNITLKGISHLGGLALWEGLMKVCISTVRKLDKSIQLNVQAGYRQKWRSPCKHWYHFVRALEVSKDCFCVSSVSKMKGRSTSEDTGT